MSIFYKIQSFKIYINYPVKNKLNFIFRKFNNYKFKSLHLNNKAEETGKLKLLRHLEKKFSKYIQKCILYIS